MRLCDRTAVCESIRIVWSHTNGRRLPSDQLSHVPSPCAGRATLPPSTQSRQLTDATRPPHVATKKQYKLVFYAITDRFMTRDRLLACSLPADILPQDYSGSGYWRNSGTAINAALPDWTVVDATLTSWEMTDARGRPTLH